MSKVNVVFTNVPFYGEGFHCIRAGCRWPFIFDYPIQPEGSVGGYNTFPFFMAYAANYLSCMNIGDVHFYDALAHKHTYETFYKNIEGMKPDIVVIETSTPSITNDLEVAQKVKDMGIEVALSGPHATVYADTLISLPQVDYVLKGEYESNSFEMCIMRKKGVYESKPLMNLDNLYPYRCGQMYNYGDGFGQDAYVRMPQLQIHTSRGCPYGCKFCLWNEVMTCRNYRVRDIRSVRKEIAQCINNWHFESILLDDDTVNVGDKRTNEIAECMDDFGIQWHAMVRADSCSWDSFHNMRNKGCVGLKIGIETFSQNGLDYLNKWYNAEKVAATIEFLLTCDFKIFLSLMDNIPMETEEDKKRTKDMVDYFTSRGCTIQHPNCMPLPGTALHKELGIRNENWGEYGKYHNEMIKI